MIQRNTGTINNESNSNCERAANNCYIAAVYTILGALSGIAAGELTYQVALNPSITPVNLSDDARVVTSIIIGGLSFIGSIATTKIAICAYKISQQQDEYNQV